MSQRRSWDGLRRSAIRSCLVSNTLRVLPFPKTILWAFARAAAGSRPTELDVSVASFVSGVAFGLGFAFSFGEGSALPNL